MEAPHPADEAARLDALRALHVLDTPPEERFDRVTRLATRHFGVPIALVSLVDQDRQCSSPVSGCRSRRHPGALRSAPTPLFRMSLSNSGPSHGEGAGVVMKQASSGP